MLEMKSKALRKEAENRRRKAESQRKALKPEGDVRRCAPEFC
jgi:hypothetical protein